MEYLDLSLSFFLLCICAYTDYKERKVYNIFTLITIPIGILNTLSLYGIKEGLEECIWLFPAFLVVYILFRIQQLGAGDAKLILAVGTLMGMYYTLITVFITFLLTWIYAFIHFRKQKLKLRESHPIDIPFAMLMLVGFIFTFVIQIATYYYPIIL